MPRSGGIQRVGVLAVAHVPDEAVDLAAVQVGVVEAQVHVVLHRDAQQVDRGHPVHLVEDAPPAPDRGQMRAGELNHDCHITSLRVPLLHASRVDDIGCVKSAVETSAHPDRPDR